MKTISFLVLSILNCCISVPHCMSQQYDNTWLIGYGGKDTPNRPWGTTNILFMNGKVDTQYVIRPVNFYLASMSVSDPLNGNLILYSNGCDIYDSNNEIISNGQGINPGYQHDTWCKHDGYPETKDGCFIRNPDETKNEYYLIHCAYGEDSLYSTTSKLYYTFITNENNIWKVKEKNQILLNEALYDGSFEVVRHSNGIDWWILSYNFNSDTSFRFLITENGIHGPNIQYFPIPHGENDWGSNSLISPNGNKVVRIDLLSGLSVMDFSRERGEFSNLQNWPFWITDKDSVQKLQVTGISVSPNSRYLYISTPIHLWQFDLNNSNVGASRILIDTFDRFKAPFGTTFYLHQLAPDGKIYINCTNGDNYMHVIHNPDLPGKACNFRQHDLKLPTYNMATMPHFPNYRLGPLTNTSEGNLSKSYVFPNPVIDKIKVSIPFNCIYQITNSIGQNILSTNKEEIDVSEIPSGIYFLTASTNDQKINKTWKFIKL